MKVTFDTKNAEECAEVLALLTEVPVKQTEMVVEASKDKNPTPSIPKTKKESQGAKKVTLGELKILAKNKLDDCGREKVKEIIGEFAEKLAEVDEKDYVELAEKLAV